MQGRSREDVTEKGKQTDQRQGIAALSPKIFYALHLKSTLYDPPRIQSSSQLFPINQLPALTCH
jgi:hypothetical protein